MGDMWRIIILMLFILTSCSTSSRKTSLNFPYEAKSVGEISEPTIEVFQSENIWLDSLRYRFINIKICGYESKYSSEYSMVDETISVVIDTCVIYALSLKHENIVDPATEQKKKCIYGLFLVDDFDDLLDSLSINYFIRYGNDYRGQLVYGGVNKKIKINVDSIRIEGNQNSNIQNADEKWYERWMEQYPETKHMRD